MNDKGSDFRRDTLIVLGASPLEVAAVLVYLFRYAYSASGSSIVINTEWGQIVLDSVEVPMSSTRVTLIGVSRWVQHVRSQLIACYRNKATAIRSEGE